MYRWVWTMSMMIILNQSSQESNRRLNHVSKFPNSARSIPYAKNYSILDGVPNVPGLRG